MQAAGATPFFSGALAGGFECSAHRRRDGRRLDMIAASRHDLLAAEDYAALARLGIRGARDGVRWHLVEAGAPGCWDWRPVLPLLRGAEAAGVHVAWDLCHYGWPDGLDPFSGEFVDRFAVYAGAFARLHLQETGRAPLVCPVNEISYFAWAGADMAGMNPGTRGRGWELKRQLVRATVAAVHAMRDTAPGTRVLVCDPVIHVVPGKSRASPAAVVAAAQGAADAIGSQWEAWDMLAGLQEPYLGGGPDMMDLVGANYYWNNQRIHRGPLLELGDPRRRPLRNMLAALHARYGKPVFLAETSIEGDARAAWFGHVAAEVDAAARAGVPVAGLCWYPILSHPGWADGRNCPNGLLEMQPRHGLRPVHAPLAQAMQPYAQRGFGGVAAPGVAAPGVTAPGVTAPGWAASGHGLGGMGHVGGALQQAPVPGVQVGQLGAQQVE